MVSPEEASLAVTYNMHGNEALGRMVARRLANSDDIFCLDLHPIAGVLDQRLLGSGGELGGQFPGYFPAHDPEILAAARASRILRQLPPDVPIVDLHCTYMPGADHVVLGNLTTAGPLAIASLLGRNIVQWLPDYAFFGYFHNAVGIETTVTDPEDMEAKADQLAVALQKIASLGVVGLHGYFNDVGTNGMAFYKRTEEIVLVDAHGDVDKSVVAVVKELESIPQPGRYGKVDISPRIADALSIRPGRHTVNTWGYQNMSKPLPRLGTLADGSVRRACFGDLLDEVDPPKYIRNSQYMYFGYSGD
jgi:hypothetical protein